MKIRKGFVSNSSSSSFVCNACGETASGWDMDLSEAGMRECENGHTYCISHETKDFPELTVEEKREVLATYSKKYENADDDDVNDEYDAGEYDYDRRYYESPSEICPCCNLEKVTQKDLLNYLFHIVGKAQDDIEQEMRNRFETIKQMYQEIEK